MFKKRLSLILFIFGIGFIILGFIYEGIFAGIPYQDPTPELFQKYMHYVSVGQNFYNIGLILLIVGMLTILSQWLYKRFLGNKG